jgi:hypothetical protein
MEMDRLFIAGVVALGALTVVLTAIVIFMK